MAPDKSYVFPAWMGGLPYRGLVCRNVDPVWLKMGRKWRLQLLDADGVIGAHSTSKWWWDIVEAEFELQTGLSHCEGFTRLWTSLRCGEGAVALAYRHGIFWERKTQHWVQGF